MQKAPFVKEEQAGNVFICMCGNSKNLPYCDGSHKGSGVTPQKVTLDAAQKVAWCGCRQSKNFPRCDGTHRTV